MKKYKNVKMALRYAKKNNLKVYREREIAQDKKGRLYYRTVYLVY